MNIFLEAEMCDYFCNVKVKKKKNPLQTMIGMGE